MTTISLDTGNFALIPIKQINANCVALNTKTEKKLLKMESYFCVEGSAEIDANLQHVSEIERDVQREKNRTISRVFFPFWYNIHDWIKNRIWPKDSLSEMRRREEMAHLILLSRLNRQEIIQAGPSQEEIQDMKTQLGIGAANGLAFFTIKQLVMLANPDIPTSSDETPREACEREVIVTLKKIYPKKHQILVATSIMTKIGSLLMKGLDAFFQK